MKVEQENIADEKAIRGIAKSYNPLSYTTELIDLLKSVYPTQNFEEWCKYYLHQAVNDLLIAKYNDEKLLKYELFSLHSQKELVGAFEMKVKSSRVDSLTINGCTTSFEIKSALDNLTKLNKQSNDYIKAFDFNYLVVDDRHIENALALVPESFGIWTFNSGRKKIYRKAEANGHIDAEVQLSLLTKKELAANFSEVEGCLKAITRNFSHQSINKRFKNALKNRYKQRWNFLVTHQQSILPVDIQFFFKTCLQPSQVYYH